MSLYPVDRLFSRSPDWRRCASRLARQRVSNDRGAGVRTSSAWVVHPIALFHVPIRGAQTSITELFALGGAQGAGSVGLEGYDWEYHEPLREDVEYRIEGGIVSAERRMADNGKPYDAVAFQIDLFDGDRDHIVAESGKAGARSFAARPNCLGRRRSSEEPA